MTKDQWKRRYELYLTTTTWQAKAEACKKAAGHECEECLSKGNLQAHHRRYPKKLGCERWQDLVCLCRNCHRRKHGLPPVGPQQLLLEELERLHEELNKIY